MIRSVAKMRDGPTHALTSAPTRGSRFGMRIVSVFSPLRIGSRYMALKNSSIDQLSDAAILDVQYPKVNAVLRENPL